MSEQAAQDEAVAAGLADSIEPEPEKVTSEIVDVATDAPVDDESGVREDADVLQLPIRQEPTDATVAGMSLVPFRDELRGLTELAVTLAIADNTPAALKGKPAAVLAVFLTGRELGIPPMTALRNLHVIDGKVTVNPKIRAAMVRREGLGKLWPHFAAWTDDSDKEHVCFCGRLDTDDEDDACTWHARRNDDPGVVYSSRYTMAQAQAVKIKNDGTKLADKDNWKNYPARMLSWRALGYLLDDAFPEVGTGLYSPDELGAITDEEGEPIIDVDSTEVLTDRAKRERKERNPEPPKPPASPDTIKAFQDRIEKIKGYERAPSVLKGLWEGYRPSGDPGEPLPKVEELLYEHCKTASALIDMVEKRIRNGEFVQVETDAVLVEGEGDTGEDRTGPDNGEAPAQDVAAEGQTDGTDEPVDQAESAAEPPDALFPPEVPFDPEGLPSEQGVAEDLAWCDRKPEGLLEEVVAEVAEIAAEELIGIMKALDLSPNGLNEQTKRARITARRIRLRMERMLNP